MFEPSTLVWNIGQFIGLVILLRYQQIQIRDNKQGLDKIMSNNYTKNETKDLVDLKLKPLEVGIAHVQADLIEVKAMLSKLLDAKNQ